MSKNFKLLAEPLPGLKVIQCQRFSDLRGFFEEIFKEEELAQLGIQEKFVQDNISHSHPGVLRGLHSQRKHTQGKWIRCLQGSILDIALDLRKDSKTFGKFHSVELHDQESIAFYLPPGFAHGFSVMSKTPALVHYKVTDRYDASSEFGVHPFDSDLQIPWKKPSHTEWILNAKDLQLPQLKDLKDSTH